MENLTRPIANIFFEFSQLSSDDGKAQARRVCMCWETVGGNVGKQTNTQNTDSCTPAAASLRGDGLHLQRASHADIQAHSRSASSHLRQSISEQRLSAALASWAAAGCVQLAESAATGS